MAYILNDKIRGMKPYEPVKGSFHVRLDANESFMLPNKDIAAKISSAASAAEYNRYPDPSAGEVCRSFADFYGIHAQNVTAGNGSDELISLITGAFLMKGDKVMTLSPDFSMYNFYSFISETKCIEYQKRPDFSVDINELIKAVNGNGVKMLIFSNPCNPTASGLRREDVRRLISSVNALVVLDEAYMDFWDQSLIKEINSYDNLIVLRTCSKAFGMAGIRLGFAAANRVLTNALKAVKSPYNVNSVTQKIGSAVISEHTWIRSCIDMIIKSKNSLYASLKSIEQKHPEKLTVYGSMTNFVLMKMPMADFVFRSLLDKGIAVRYLGEFLRVSAGTSAENSEFIDVFKSIICNL